MALLSTFLYVTENGNLCTLIDSYTWKWNYYSNNSYRINQGSSVMAHGRSGEPEVKAFAFLEERQQQAICIVQVYLLGHHCSSAHFHCRQQHSSLERLMKILASLMWTPSCTNAYPYGKECEWDITSLSFLWHPRCGSLWQLVASHASWPSTIETPDCCSYRLRAWT